jgi:PAS domain S-box-containing protein
MNKPRRIVDEPLREGEERWRRLVEALPQLVWSATPDGACDYFSAQWTRYTGVAESELLGWRWMDVLHPDDLHNTRHVWTDSVAGRRAYDVEYRVRRHDGVYRWFKTRGVPINDSKGSIVYWFGSCTDITDAKRAEEALRESEQRWRSLTEALPQLVWSATPDGACDYFSAQWTQHTGVAESELLGWRWMNVLHPDDLDSTRQVWMDSVEGRRAYDVEYRVRRHDGVYRWFKTRGVPIRDNGGNIVKWFGSCTDITDGKQTEEALRHREQELQKARSELEKKVAERTAELHRTETYLAEAQRLTRMGSWALNVASREFVHLSDQYYQIFGFDPERGIPSLQTIRQRVDPEDRATADASLEKAILEGNDFELNYRIVLPDGIVKFIHSVAHPVFNASSGTPVEFVGTAMDVSERKQAEENLRESDRRYRQAQAELAHVTRVTTLGELTASIVHEVNQPLAAIAMNGEACLRFLGREAPDLNEVHGALTDMISHSHRAAEVIRRIRALCQKADSKKAPLNINEVIDEVLYLIQREVIDHGVAMRRELSLEIAPVLGDRVALQQVIINLMVNGMEAMSSVADRKRDLLIRSQQHADGVLVAVQDSGVGIAPDNVDRLFNSFYTTKPNGMGMGLSICRSIIEAHGGKLWAVSNSGRGATFQFTLPHQHEVTS